MASELITGIGELWTVDPEVLEDPDLGYGAGVLAQAAVVVEDDRFAWVGPAARAPAADRRTDLAGRAALPGWVDSHSHLVFAGDRAAEFAAAWGSEFVDCGSCGHINAESGLGLWPQGHSLLQDLCRPSNPF